jgi:hypothetical protein
MLRILMNSVIKLIKPVNMDPGVLRVKLFPHSLVGLARAWYENVPKKEKRLWFNLRA